MKEKDRDKRIEMLNEIIKIVRPDYSTIDKNLIEKYKEREDELKSFKKLIDQLIEANQNIRNSNSERWVNLVAESNVRELKRIKGKINQLSKRKEINKFVLASQGNARALMDINLTDSQVFLLFEICFYSPKVSIEYDLGWMFDVPMDAFIDIALGISDPDILLDSLPVVLSRCNEYVTPFLTEDKGFKDQLLLFTEVRNSAESNRFLVSNILLFTLIESIAKRICIYAYKTQYPDTPEEDIEQLIYQTHKSLPSLLSDDIWKEDYEIATSQLIYYLRNTADPDMIKLRKAVLGQLSARELEDYNTEREKNGLPKVDEYQKFDSPMIRIPIGSRLHVLQRIYNNDRNQIVHGFFNNFGHSWKNYVYLNVLVDLCIVGDYYYEKVKVL